MYWRDARRPVALFGNAIGDHLLALPALRALAGLFPRRLRSLCRPQARLLGFHDRRLAGVHRIAMRSTRSHGRRAWTFDADAAARAVGDCDMLLSLCTWHSRAVDRLLALLSPVDSAGFAPAFRRALGVTASKHAADLAFDLPRLFDPRLEIEDFSEPPFLRPRAWRLARRVRGEVPPGGRVLAVHADTKRAKRWPVRCWIRLLDAFLERHPDFVAFDVGLVDLGLDRGRLGARVVPCAGLPVDMAFALVAEADLFVGVDSCMLHAADLFRVPGVGLFGPTGPREFGFRFGPHRHVTGRGALRRIEPAAVLAALEDVAHDHPARLTRTTRRIAAPGYQRSNGLRGRR